MDKKAEQMLKGFKDKINIASCELDQFEASCFFSELADWAYAMSESLQIYDEPEIEDNDEQ